VLDEVIGRILGKDASSGEACLPNLERLVLAGFSAGAQVAQRYALVGKALLATDKAEVFIGATMAPLYLDHRRPVLDRNGRGVDPSCWGARGLPGFAINCRTRPDLRECNLTAWADCITRRRYAFEDFRALPPQRWFGATAFTADNCYNNESLGSGLRHRWDSWKWQPRQTEGQHNRYLAAYLQDREAFNRRYAARRTVWFVGTRDGQGHPDDRRSCADEITGDTHLQKTVAAYTYTDEFFRGRHNHTLYLLEGVGRTRREMHRCGSFAERLSAHSVGATPWPRCVWSPHRARLPRVRRMPAGVGDPAAGVRCVYVLKRREHRNPNRVVNK